VSERPEPQAKGDIVKVKLIVCPMCTEWQAWRAGKQSHELGHEGVGFVVDAAESRMLRTGDRVVVMPHAGCGRCPSCLSGEHILCTEQRDLLAETGSRSGIGCYAQYLLKPDYLLWKVPADLSTMHAAMAVCALGPTFTAMRRMAVTARDAVLVSGCGAVGLGAIVNARTIGARVIALEINPYRMELAARLGAEMVLDPRDPELIAKVRAARAATAPTRRSRPATIRARRPRCSNWYGRAVASPLSPGQARCRCRASPARASISSAAGIGTIRSTARRWHSVCASPGRSSTSS
jgi:D-arabinose 1-dehydrogenase-like Zn-dependent alcohol dehydrogenase